MALTVLLSHLLHFDLWLPGSHDLQRPPIRCPAGGFLTHPVLTDLYLLWPPRSSLSVVGLLRSEC